MEASSAAYRIGFYSLPAQFILLLAALTVGAAFEFGHIFTLLYLASLFSGLAALGSALVLWVSDRRLRWALLAGASAVLTLFAVTFATAIGYLPLPIHR